MTLTYYRDLRAYGDGKHLYVSASGIKRAWRGVGYASLSHYAHRLRPGLTVEHWHGFAGGTLTLYRRDRVRKVFGDPSRSRLGLPHDPSDFLGMWIPDEDELTTREAMLDVEAFDRAVGAPGG